jgi:ubiquinone/menaquinone biosynthesis C-methylase UbiE
MTRRQFSLIFVPAVCAAAQNEADINAPFVTTPPEVVEEMLKLARLRPGDVLYDLGSGDGRIVIAAAQRYGARAVGIDINPQRIKEAEANARMAGVAGKVTFREQDFMGADLHDAAAVTLYLLPWVNAKLKPKLMSELKPGTRVVSHEFAMPDWEPDRVVRLRLHKIYCWLVPGRPAGPK